MTPLCRSVPQRRRRSFSILFSWCVPSACAQVLTGRYTPKIDMFSFAVLLVQMCTGLYPSIDDRVSHIGA